MMLCCLPHRQSRGDSNCIEQRKPSKSTSNPASSCQASDTLSTPTSSSSKNHAAEGKPKPLVDSSKSTRTPESVLEPVLHGRSVAINDLSTLVKQVVPKGTFPAQQDREKYPSKLRDHCLSSSRSNSELSLGSKAEFLSSIRGGDLCKAAAPSAKSTTASDCGMSLNTLLEIGSKSEPAFQDHISLEPQLIVQHDSLSPASNIQNSVDKIGALDPLISSSDINLSLASSIDMVAKSQEEIISNPEQLLNSIGDCGSLLETSPSHNSTLSANFGSPNVCSTEIDPILHSTSGTNSVPSAPSVPFQNPNPSAQAPLDCFNLEIPSSFDFSSAMSSPFSSASVSTYHSQVSNSLHIFDYRSMQQYSNDCVMHQLLGDVSTGVSDLDAEGPLPNPLPFPFCSQTNFISESSFFTPLQGSTFYSPTDLNTHSGSQTQDELQRNSNIYSPNPEWKVLQDIMQQFM